jgi:hypothetical protein
MNKFTTFRFPSQGGSSVSISESKEGGRWASSLRTQNGAVSLDNLKLEISKLRSESGISDCLTRSNGD